MNPPRDDDNGTHVAWAQYRALILADLRRINASVELISQDLQSVKVSIAVLQTKAALVGALAGALMAIGVALIKAFV